MTIQATTEASEAWADHYARRGVWWADPNEISAERLRAWGRKEWVSRLVEAAGVVPGRHVRVLEAGCGSGQYSLALALRGFSVDAFDFNRSAVDRTLELRARVGDVGPGRRPAVFQGDLLRIGAATDAYDLVFNQAVFEYFVADAARHAAVSEMVRVAKPGGAVVVIIACPRHPFRALWRCLGWPGFSDQPDVVELTATMLENQLSRGGLVDVSTDGIAPWRSLFFWPRWYERWAATRRAVAVLTRMLEQIPLPRSLRRRLGLQIVAVGRKPPIPSASTHRKGVTPW